MDNTALPLRAAQHDVLGSFFSLSSLRSPSGLIPKHYERAERNALVLPRSECYPSRARNAWNEGFYQVAALDDLDFVQRRARDRLGNGPRILQRVRRALSGTVRDEVGFYVFHDCTALAIAATNASCALRCAVPGS